MVRLKDLPIYEQDHLLSKLLPPLGPLPWVVNNKSLNKMKIAMITTAVLIIAMKRILILQMQVSEPFLLKQKAKTFL
jgi:hypothetical protein